MPDPTPSSEVVIQPTVNLPYIVQKAIFDTIAEVVMLAKTRENEYAGYAYASVDDFYMQVVPIALKHGIRWDLTATGFPRRDGNIEWWGFAVTLHFLDDTEKRAHCFSDYAKLVIKHPLRGPQDTGTVFSYADKVFCRQFLKVPTGEPDGDEADNTQRVNPDRQQKMDSLPDNHRSHTDRRATRRRDTFIERVKSINDGTSLNEYLRRVSDDLRMLESQDMGSYNAIMKAVQEKRKEFADHLRSRVAQQRPQETPRPSAPAAPVTPHRENGRRILRPPE